MKLPLVLFCFECFHWFKRNFSVGVLLLRLATNEQEERSSMRLQSSCEPCRIQLHAQRRTLQLIIEVVVRVFVETQRRDAYYRNDPSKYGLKACKRNLEGIGSERNKRLWLFTSQTSYQTS